MLQISWEMVEKRNSPSTWNVFRSQSYPVLYGSGSATLTHDPNAYFTTKPYIKKGTLSIQHIGFSGAGEASSQQVSHLYSL